MVMKQPLGPGMSSDMDYTTDRVNEGKQTVHAVFASMETQLPWDLTANYGVRYTWVDSEMNTATASKNGYTRITMPRRTINREYVNVDDGSAGDTGSSDNSRAVFNAGLIWKGIDNLALRATWSQGFRAAILQERYLATSMGGQGTLYGNPDLKPETSNNFEVGARFNNGPVVIDAAAFYSDAKNYITTEYLADGVNSRYVNADKFIDKLDHGLDEEVRERGNNFSAGQRQLLSFARTIIHKPSVMILDEATANIDTETELLIQDSLEKMRSVGTMLIVAHRLSTIQHADNIIVLSHGKILEQGNHQELLAKHGRYYQLYTLQYHKEQLEG